MRLLQDLCRQDRCILRCSIPCPRVRVPNYQHRIRAGSSRWCSRDFGQCFRGSSHSIGRLHRLLAFGGLPVCVRKLRLRLGSVDWRWSKASRWICNCFVETTEAGIFRAKGIMIAVSKLLLGGRSRQNRYLHRPRLSARRPELLPPPHVRATRSAYTYFGRLSWIST